ncbi:MAG: sulfurtransferase TusA family protein [Azospirillaceae bacterium]|nr:sulfurtransferase TusA family protein [Azospirillaceae bacterium]
MAESRRLDAKGLRCPLPVLRARRMMKQMAVGDVLVVEATDPGAITDFPAFCAATGHCLVESRREGDILVFTIGKQN